MVSRAWALACWLAVGVCLTFLSVASSFRFVFPLVVSHCFIRSVCLARFHCCCLLCHVVLCSCCVVFHPFMLSSCCSSVHSDPTAHATHNKTHQQPLFVCCFLSLVLFSLVPVCLVLVSCGVHGSSCVVPLIPPLVFRVVSVLLIPIGHVIRTSPPLCPFHAHVRLHFQLDWRCSPRVHCPYSFACSLRFLFTSRLRFPT